MSLKEIADFIHSNVSITGTIRTDNTLFFSASIAHVELIDGQFLTSEHGYGGTPEKALNDYVNNVKGKAAVFSHYGNNRFEFKFPETLTVF
jgi:hypothetical protein